jgi:hypothetical protein
MLFIFMLTGFSPSMSGQNHTAWTSLLKKHVKQDGLVDYIEFQKEIKSLDNYLLDLRNTNPKMLSFHEAKAFWINVYNAFTIKMILDNYPIKSIMDIKYGNNSAWDHPFINISGKNYTLNEIEKNILMGIYKDPMIHFGINCAAKGCPPLRAEAYKGSNVDQQLKQQAIIFLENKSWNRFDGSTWKLSKIFEWYSSDFESDSGSLEAFIQKITKVKTRPIPNIKYLEYNWALNSMQN